jgi:hypothetical protein
MILRRSRGGSGWILQSKDDDTGLWFDTKESALFWAKSMGLTVTEE